MKKDVLIHIKGIQTADGDQDVTELFTQGNLYQKDGNYYIMYDESETTGFQGCKTTLKIEGTDKVTLIRHGPTNSNLTIERGVRHVGFYGTEQGDMLIGIKANSIDIALDTNGGNLSFQYSMDINASHVSNNEIYINVKECNQ